jgi:hypothetical protein
MFKNSMVSVAILVILLAISVACENNEPTEHRSVVTVLELNEGAPLISDIVDGGSITADVVPVEFYNRPYSGMIITNPDKPHGEFIITRYRVDWTPGLAGGPVLPPYEGAISLSVATGESAEGRVLVVTHSNKANPPLSNIIGTNTEYQMTATITFYGYEAGTTREIPVVATIGVIFADFQ